MNDFLAAAYAGMAAAVATQPAPNSQLPGMAPLSKADDIRWVDPTTRLLGLLRWPPAVPAAP